MSLLRVEVEGKEPGLIMHAWNPAPLLTDEQEKERRLIIAKTESKRSPDEADALRRYDCLRSIWLDGFGRPAVPQTVFRAVLEAGARTERRGGDIRSNVIVERTVFTYDEDRLGSAAEQWGETLRFDAGVVVQRSRINRTRALFPPPWSIVAELDIFDLDSGAPSVGDTEIVSWLNTAGRSVGIGDWRPQKSGTHGRFAVVSAEWVE